MVHVKAHKNPSYAIVSEKYLQDILAYVEKNNSKQVKSKIESALSKLKEAQDGNKAPRKLTNYQQFSAKKYQKVKDDLLKENGVEPKFEQISSRIGELWREEKESKEA